MKKLTFIFALLAVFMLQGCFWGGDGRGREHHDEGHHDGGHHDEGHHDGDHH